MAGRSLIAIAVSLAMVTVVLNVAHPSGSELIVSGHTWGGIRMDGASAVEVDSAGNVLIAGYYYEETDYVARGFVAKFAADGSLAWNLGLQYQSSQSPVVDMALDSNGSAYLLLNAYPSDLLAKVSSSGTIMFAEEIEGINQPNRLAYNPTNGGVIIVGDRTVYGDGAVASFSSTGSQIWTRMWVGPEYASMWGAAVDAYGNVFAVMDRWSPDNVGVVEFSPQGDLLKQVVLATEPNGEWSWDITIGPAGDVYVLGYDFIEGNALVSRLTPALEQVWSEYLDSSGSAQECYRVAIAGDGTIHAIGTGYAPYGDSGGAVGFHLGDDGSLIEASIYLDTDTSWLSFSDATVDTAGNIILAGSSYGLPALYSTPIPDVVPTPTPGTWVGDNASWYDYSLSVTATTLDAYAPSAVVDSYDVSYAAQAWFGRVGTPELRTSIEYKVSGQDPSMFSFRGSVSGGERPYTFTWNFGDGTSGSGKRITHAYSAPGMYAVVLIVTDGTGKFGYSSEVVRVYGPPVIEMVSHNQPQTNTDTWFIAYAHDVDGGEIVAYAWDFGDGSSVVTSENSVSHVYTTAGYVLFSLVVTDDEGATASYEEMMEVIELPNILPVPVFSYWPTPFVGTSVTFDGSLSYDNDGWITQYAWTFGDGYNASGPVVNHTYSAQGMYYVTLWVTDNRGATSSTTRNITVYQTSQQKNWTYLVYLDADNNLEEVGSVDFMEMSSVGSDQNINIVVEMDRSPYYDYNYGDWTTTKRFYVSQWMTPDPYNALQDLGELNMGDQLTLLDFITWGVTAYPADNYALILWDHGGGWDGAVCWDETNGYDALSLEEVENALAHANNDTGARINLLGFDACLMGMVEVAYEVIEYVDVIAFSEESVPWDGFPYNDILWELKSNPTMSALTLGSITVQKYMEFYSNVSMGDPYATMSSMSMADSGPLYLAIEQFSNELRMAIPTEQVQILEWMYATEYFAYVDYIDLSHFAQIVSGNTAIESLKDAALAVVQAVNATLNAEGHGSMHPNAHGLSIFFPQSNSSYLEFYASALDFTAAYSWDEFLVEVLSAKDDQYEPDDDFTQATPILHGETQIHSIGNGGTDVDWATFVVSEPSIEVRVNTSGRPGVWTDTVIELYDAFGVPNYPIAVDDDSGPNGCSMIQMYLSQGTYYVKVRAFYTALEIPWYGVSVYIGDIPNIPPYADIYYWPYDPGVGTEIYFQAYAYDPDGYVADIIWDFGDGTVVPGGENYTQHAYASPGNYTVTLTVTDDDGASATATTTVYVVMNLMPVAIMSFYPPLPDPYDTVVFEGGLSYDPDGYIQDYYWQFGDGYAAYGSYVYHYYYEGGLYLVTLTVMDNRGATNSTSAWIHVNMPPVAVIVPSVEIGKVGSPVTFDGSGSYDPEGSPIVDYMWYFNDGSGSVFGPIVTHTFYEPGSYDVHLRVYEENGSYGYAELLFVVVTPVPPAAVIAYSPANPLVGQEVLFDGLSSVDPDGSVLTYIWQLGDGTVATGSQVTHVYAAPGTYDIQLTVIDEDKLIDDSTTKITVVSKPVAGFEYYPAAPVAGQETSFYAVGSYDPMGITLYVWAFGDGTYAQGWQAAHTFAAIGDYTVTLTVTNAAGVQTTISKTVSVSAAQLAGAESSVFDQVSDESAGLGIDPLVLVLCAISMAIGCLVGDVVSSLSQRRKGI